MNIKKPLLCWSVAVLAVLMLTACGSPTSTPATSSPVVGDSTTSLPATGENTVQKAQTGQVTFTVQFPQAALKKALMDERTVSINVQWDSYYPYYTSGSTLLTPDPVTGLATAQLDVPVGYTKFMAIAMDNNNIELDMTSTAGEITAGNNTVYLTFLSGDWQFVDANDNPLPQTFDTTTTLAGFSMQSNQAYGAAAKATIDTTKPYSWSDYQLQWQTTTAPIGPVMEAWHVAQFNATASQFGSDWLNITDPTRSDSIYDSVPYQPGDRMVWIHDWEADDVNLPDLRDASGNDLGPAFSTAGNTEVFDGTHIVGNLMAMTFTSFNAVAGSTVASCDEFYYPQATTAQAARVAALKAGLSAKAGKAAIGEDLPIALGTITATYQECDYSNNTIYNVTEVFSDPVKREFRAKGSQAGSVFTPPAPPAPPTAAAMIGTWIGDPTAGDPKIVTFLDEATYVAIEEGTGTNLGLSDFEYGNFIYDSTTGTFTANALVDTLPTWGPAGAGGPLSVTISGNTMTIDGSVIFTKLAADPTKPIVGSWAVQEPNPTVVTFLADGTYYISQNEELATGISAGIERGNYTYNGTTLTATPIVQTHGGGAGFGTVGIPASINLTITADNATFSDLDYSVPLKRVIAPATPAPLLGTWYNGSTSGDFSVITMLDTNTYVGATGTFETGASGIEYGPYSFTANQIVATPFIKTSAVGWGLSYMTQLFPYTYSMLIVEPSGSGFFRKLITNVDYPLIGTWGGIDTTTQDGVVMTFLDDGSYMMVQTSPADGVGQPGNEWGTYNWDMSTGILFASVVGDTNGEWGLSHPQGTLQFTVTKNTITNKDELIIQELDGSGTPLYTMTIPKIY